MTDNTLRQIDRIIEQRPVSREALKPFRELVALMQGMPCEPQAFDPENRLKGLKEEKGFPLFSREELPVDMEGASAIFSKFLAHLATLDREDKEGIKKAIEKAEDDPLWIKRLLKAVLGEKEDEISKAGGAVNLDPGTLNFLGRLALRPTLVALREALSDRIDKNAWKFGYCPVCGSQPNMAFFDSTGKRHLHCGLCAEQWLYPRLKCPFCENQDHKQLGYFHADEEEGFRVDFCRACSRYIKTVDTRVFEEPAPMEVEHLATLYLDLLAVENGFK